MPYLYGLLFTIIGPFVAILLAVIWLVLFIRFGLLTLWLEESEITIDKKKRITKNVTRVLLGFVLFGFPVTVPIIFSLVVSESSGMIHMFLYSPIWLALAIDRVFRNSPIEGIVL